MLRILYSIVLLSIITIQALLQRYFESCLIGIILASFILQEYNSYAAESKWISSRSLKPIYSVKKNNVWISVDKSILKIGDIIMLCSGTTVPYECEILEDTVQAIQTIGDKYGAVGSRYISYKPGDVIKGGEIISIGEASAKIISMVISNPLEQSKVNPWYSHCN